MPRKISPEKLLNLLGTERFPLAVDVRRAEAFRAASTRIPASVWCSHLDVADLTPKDRPIVVYCVHGHNVSEIAAARLAARGVDVAVLEGGIEAWTEAGGPLVDNNALDVQPSLQAPTIWVTRARPKIDRIACPWLIRRFVDPLAVFHFVSAEWVVPVAEEIGGIPFDVEGARYTHRGDGCTFDAIVETFGLGADAPLLHLADIVRGADTARPELAPQAAGLLAVSLGLSALEQDDLAQLEKGMLIYDALYAWCRHATAETHRWTGRAA